ncbi:MAG: hypothetical protein IIU36_00305 [Firmicutes bacterium]|nr:hypothetical protein [Bacillota bacterium]
MRDARKTIDWATMIILLPILIYRGFIYDHVKITEPWIVNNEPIIAVGLLSIPSVIILLSILVKRTNYEYSKSLLLRTIILFSVVYVICLAFGCSIVATIVLWLAVVTPSVLLYLKKRDS